MPTIKEIQQQIITEFKMFSEWSDKYQYIIDQGRKLEKLNEQDKINENLVKGCQSQLWVVSEIKENKIYYKADCNSPIPKGIVSLMIRTLSAQSLEDINNAELFFIKETQLINYLSPNRTNGLVALISKMKSLANYYETEN